MVRVRVRVYIDETTATAVVMYWVSTFSIWINSVNGTVGGVLVDTQHHNYLCLLAVKVSLL